MLVAGVGKDGRGARGVEENGERKGERKGQMVKFGEESKVWGRLGRW